MVPCLEFLEDNQAANTWNVVVVVVVDLMLMFFIFYFLFFIFYSPTHESNPIQLDSHELIWTLVMG